MRASVTIAYYVIAGTFRFVCWLRRIPRNALSAKRYA